MRGHGFAFICAFCFFIHLAAVSASDAYTLDLIWQKAGNGLMDSDLLAVDIRPDNPEIVFVTSGNAVYRSLNSGETWDTILSFRGTNNIINTIAASPVDPRIIYAGTTNGLYVTNNVGSNWEKEYSGVGGLENTVSAIALHPKDPQTIYIGTFAGVFISHDKGANWTKARNIPSTALITAIAVDPSQPHIVYAAADRGIYRSLNSGAGWKRVYASDRPEDDLQALIEDEEKDIVKIRDTVHIRDITVDPSDGQTVYAGTSQGLLITTDGGSTWKGSGSLGLVSRDIRHVEVNPGEADSIYVATGRGVMRYSTNSGSWETMYEGLASDDIRYLAVAVSGGDIVPRLWATTNRGAFKTVPVDQMPASQNSRIKAEEAHLRFVHEPAIEEILEAAIDYAEVSPEKIRQWRKAAASRAWLPDLKIEYDESTDWQSSTYYYNYSGAKVYADDDITDGKDRGWSISLTWELGDLIWNSSQTAIDSRSKLMVELRDDILNEVTRLYYERRRFQYEMILDPPADVSERIEKELRLKELTANIDALTGSYLSKRLKQGSGG